MLWTILFGGLFIGAILGIFFIVFRTHKFSIVQKIGQKHKIISWIVSLIPLFIVASLSMINVFAAIVVLLHLVVIWILCDIIGFIVKKITHIKPKRYYSGFIAICLTIIYMSYGWFSAHHIFQTDYDFKADKDIKKDNLRIALIADSHIGITLDGDDFSKEMERISQTNPDVVIVAGDYVDDDTLKKDMIKSCEALGNIKSTYGVYFIYGNHDKGYYQYRDFTSTDLKNELAKNKIKALEDESVLVDNKFYIIGRQDRQVADRADMKTLIENLDNDKYKILIDHQPNDYDNEAGLVDLVVSGHTHGGHIFPTGPIGMLMKANDLVYGTKNIDGTDFVVTSGISGWAIPFKTATISEYVIIDIKN